jgi:hypothetical protein
MLYAESRTRGLTQVTSSIEQNVGNFGVYWSSCWTNSFRQIAALKRDKEYQQYIKSLQNASYFGSEIEGSSRWNTLETRAATMWLDMRPKT